MTPVILFLLELLSCIKVSTDSKAIDRTFLKWIEAFFFPGKKTLWDTKDQLLCLFISWKGLYCCHKSWWVMSVLQQEKRDNGYNATMWISTFILSSKVKS